MFRRILALLMLMMMLPAALAQAETTPLYQVSTFAGRLPERLQEPLSALISDETRIVSGAAIQHSGKFYNADEIASWESYCAMIVVDTDEGPLLLAAAWVDGMPWQVDDFTRFLRREDNVSVSIYQPEPNRIPVFSVDYADRSGMVSDLMIFRGNRLWCMDGHVNLAQNTTVSNEMGMIAVTDGTGREKFRCADPFYLNYMADITTFPTNHSEAQALTWLPDYAPYSPGMLLYCQNANLRREPTTKSESLGMYLANVPMIFTGEQEQGTSWPWYQVQIGNTLGWMSSIYVKCHPNYGYSPIPLGRALTDCPMYANPGDAQPLQQLEPGATFHILTEYKGMYHICIPQGEISWAVDRDGVYGYIPVEGVLTGYSPSALDALEAAQ